MDTEANLCWYYAFQVPEANVAEVEKLLRELLNIVANEEPNVVTFNVHRVPGQPGHYSIYEEFATAADAERHGTGPGMRRFRDRFVKLVATHDRQALELATSPA